MRAGRLNRRVTFQTRGAAVEDGFGNAVAAWSVLATVWGDLKEQSGSERLALGRVEAVASATLRVRRSTTTAAITEADRVLDHLGRTWNIRQVIDLAGAGRTLDLLLERGVAT